MKRVLLVTTSQIVNYVLDSEVSVLPLFLARYHTGLSSLLRKLYFNKTELKKYNSELFHGQLFSGSHKLILNSNSPLRRFWVEDPIILGLAIRQ